MKALIEIRLPKGLTHSLLINTTWRKPLFPALTHTGCLVLPAVKLSIRPCTSFQGGQGGFLFYNSKCRGQHESWVFSLLWTVPGENVALAACTWVDGDRAVSGFHVHHPSGRLPTWALLHIEGKHPADLLDQLLSFLQEIRCFTFTLLSEMLLAAQRIIRAVRLKGS